MTRRLILHTLIVAIVAATAVVQDGRAVQASACWVGHLTGYVETGYPTADGTPTAGQAWSIAAAHASIPFDTLLDVQGVGTLRVADRGLLRPNDLDVLVPTVGDAYALTGEYQVCPR